MRTLVNKWQTYAVAALLALAGLMATNATSALWSDSAQVSNNTVQAGTVSVSLEALSGVPVNEVVDGNAIHGSGGLFPGESTDWGRMRIKNDGTGPQVQYMHLDEITASVSGICGYYTMELAHDTNNDLAPDNIFSTTSLGALNGAGNRVQVSDGVVGDNNHTDVLVRLTLDSNTPNSFNGTGATCTWKKVVTAEQVAP